MSLMSIAGPISPLTSWLKKKKAHMCGWAYLGRGMIVVGCRSLYRLKHFHTGNMLLLQNFAKLKALIA